MNKLDIKLLAEECVNELKIILEGMDVLIKDLNLGRRLDSLDGICNHILEEIISPIILSLPFDQQQYYKKNGIGFYNMLSPDGGYHSDKNSQIINFYISGFTSNTIKEILKGIFQEFRKLGIKWGDIKKEQSQTYKSEVIRITIKENNYKYNGPPEMHLSNRNAYVLFRDILQYDILQYEGEYFFSMDADELMQRIKMVFKDKGWIDKHKIDTKHFNRVDDLDLNPEENPHDKIIQSLGGSGTSVGISAEGLKERLDFIYSIAKWAVDHGHKVISVG